MRSQAVFVARCLIVLAMLTGVVSAWAISHAPHVMAQGDDDDEDERSKKNNNVGDGEGGANDNDEEHDTTGQVLEIRPLEEPQKIIIGNADGAVTVMLMKANLLTETGVGIGDHVRVTGEKVHELLFEATEIHIRTRCCGEPTSDNDDDSDNISDPGTLERDQKIDDDGEYEDDDDEDDVDDSED